MKKLLIVVLVCTVCSLSQAVQTEIMNDGLEADENLAGNGWGGAWNFSGGTHGNPANYMWSAGDRGTVTKDTSYAIQSGDVLELQFDIKGMDGGAAPGFPFIGALFYNDGSSDVVLGSVVIDSGDIASGWNEDLGSLIVIAPVASDGYNLQVSFAYTYSGTPAERRGIDNVIVLEGLPTPPNNFWSIADGNWSTVAIWESDESGSRAAATSLPNEQSNVNCYDHTVSLDVDSTIAFISVGKATDPNFTPVLNVDVADKTLTVTDDALVSQTLNISAGNVSVDGDTTIQSYIDSNLTAAGLIELSDGTFEPKNLLIIEEDGVYRQTGGSSVFSITRENNWGGIGIRDNALMEISGGTMLHTSRTSLKPTSIFRIIGDEASITLHQTTGNTKGTFEFIFDETGISNIYDDGIWYDLQNVTFVVDGTNFTGAGGAFVLFSGEKIPTAMPGSVYYTVTGFGTEGVDWFWTEISDLNASPVFAITLTVPSNSATMPSPKVGETVFGGDQTLSWKAGETAATHDVYFGTVNPPVDFKETVTGTTTSCDVTGLASGTYYWRVDAVDAGAVVYPGDVWNFDVDILAASNLFPADGAPAVAADVTLTWTPGDNNPTHDVWFGLAPGALELVADDLPTTPAEYTPSRHLIWGQTYYWKIVEDDTHETPVQSFRVTPAGHNTHWTNGDAGSNLWTSAANWDASRRVGDALHGGVPGIYEFPDLNTSPYIDGTGPCVIDNTVNAYAHADWLLIGIPGLSDPGVYANDPTLVMTGGDLGVKKSIALGNAGPGVVNMTGGTMNIPVMLRIGNAHNAMFNMSGGTINVGTLIFRDNTAVKIFNLTGGTVNADSISLAQSTTLNLNGGTLIINGDVTATINAGIASGYVVGFDGLGNAKATYDGVTNKTTVVVSLDDPGVRAGDDQDIYSLSTSVTATAWDPNGRAMTYLWTADDGGVILDTPTALTTTVTFPAYAFVPYELTLTATNSSAGQGSDSVLVTANDPQSARDPNAFDGEMGVAVAPTLSWTAGLDSISSDVWFGTDAEAMELVSDDQTGTTYAPGALIRGQTYYWAVDETDSGLVIHDGRTWSFTVVVISGGITTWTGAGGSDLWNVEANWDNGVPGIGTTTNIHENAPALIDSSVEAVATSTTWNRWGIIYNPIDPNDPTVLDMTGGSLTLYRWALGNAGPATVNISGGTVSILDMMVIGDQYDTTLNIDGGTVNIGYTIDSYINATTNFINLNSGVLTASNMVLNGDYVDPDDPVDPNHIYPGTILDISAGTLILDGDDTSVVQGYIDAGRIIAYGDTGTVIVDLDDAVPEAITTTVTACTSVFNADLNYDCAVNVDDLLLVAQGWLSETPATGDTQPDGSVDLLDFVAVAAEWLLDGNL